MAEFIYGGVLSQKVGYIENLGAILGNCFCLQSVDQFYLRGTIGSLIIRLLFFFWRVNKSLGESYFLGCCTERTFWYFGVGFMEEMEFCRAICFIIINQLPFFLKSILFGSQKTPVIPFFFLKRKNLSWSALQKCKSA